MTNGKAIIGLAALLVLTPFAAWNWWSYYRGETGTASRPAVGQTASVPAAAPSTAAGTPAARGGTRARAAAREVTEEVPKRAPLSGEAAIDPFGWTAVAGRGRSGPLSAGAIGDKPRPLQLHMVMVDGDRRWAAVNGGLYGVGDRVGGAVIARIEAGAVELIEDGGSRLMLALGTGGVQGMPPAAEPVVAVDVAEAPVSPEAEAAQARQQDGKRAGNEFDGDENKADDHDTQPRDESGDGMGEDDDMEVL